MLMQCTLLVFLAIHPLALVVDDIHQHLEPISRFDQHATSSIIPRRLLGAGAPAPLAIVPRRDARADGVVQLRRVGRLAGLPQDAQQGLDEERVAGVVVDAARGHGREVALFHQGHGEEPALGRRLVDPGRLRGGFGLEVLHRLADHRDERVEREAGAVWRDKGGECV